MDGETRAAQGPMGPTGEGNDPVPTLQRIGTAAAVAALALAVLALVGWTTGVLLLARVRSDFIPMAPNTAAAFAILSVALLVPRLQAWGLRGVAVALAAIALHVLATGPSMGFAPAREPFPLGVMSPVTAAGFLTAAAALFALTFRRSRDVALVPALATTFLGLLTVLGYAYGTPLLYRGSVIPLALPTGLAFAAAGTALVARLGPTAWPARAFTGPSVRSRMMRLFVPAVAVLALMHGWLALVIASTPFEYPAILAAALAALSIPVTGLLVSRLSKRIAREIEQAEARRLLAEAQRTRLEERERAAAALVRQREDMARLVVHDLRNPLTTLVVGLDLLSLRVQGDPRAREIVSDLSSAAMTLDRMTLDILDVSVSEDGVLAPRVRPIDLPGLLAAIARSMRLRTIERGSEIVISSSLSTPHMEADPQLLQRVFENLLDNALKYAPERRPIRIEARDVEAGTIRVEVIDEGPGVPPEARGRVFEPYVRLARDAAKSVRRSRGLGLAFCKLAVEAHGGRIGVEENRPTGSRFCVELPRSQAVRPGSEGVRPAARPARGAPTPPPSRAG